MSKHNKQEKAADPPGQSCNDNRNSQKHQGRTQPKESEAATPPYQNNQNGQSSNWAAKRNAESVNFARDQNIRGVQHQERGNMSSNQQRDLQNKFALKQKWSSNAREHFIQSDGKKKPYKSVCLASVPSDQVMMQLERSLGSVQQPVGVTLELIKDNSIKFWQSFPRETARLHVLKQDGVHAGKLLDFVHSVYPIIHHTTLNLMMDFLNYKMKSGTRVEKAVYEGMDIIAFVDRLLKKRPLSFLGANDQYYLRNFKHGYGGFEYIGTDNERHPLVLQDYLSYDEMRIAALISLSSWSIFVNDGNRKNFGDKGKEGSFQREGVIVGQVGSRLKKEGVMEYLDCVVTREENTKERGYGCKRVDAVHINSVWGKFWGSNLPLYQEANEAINAQRDGITSDSAFDYMLCGRDLLFNVTVYKKRMAITAEILLCEASSRAKAANKKAYVHVVGLGLGVWRATKQQDHLFIEAWGDALKNLANTDHIGHVDFSYIDSWAVHGVKSGEQFPDTNITIHFSKRNLHDLVPDDCILVCNYAWDGNSYPGNEYYLEKLCSTGDSAAACSSCIVEIHNWDINPIIGANTLRIATKAGLALPWQVYVNENYSSQLNLNQYGVAYTLNGPAMVRPQQNVVDDRSAGARTTATQGAASGTSNDHAWEASTKREGGAGNTSHVRISSKIQSPPARSAATPDATTTAAALNYDGNEDGGACMDAPAASSLPNVNGSTWNTGGSSPSSATEQKMEMDSNAIVTNPSEVSLTQSNCKKDTTETKFADSSPVPKKSKQSNERGRGSGDESCTLAAPVSEEIQKQNPPEAKSFVETKEKEVPKQIPHPTIPGLSIPNPECKEPQKQKKSQNQSNRDAVSSNKGGNRTKNNKANAKGKGNKKGKK